ncbi:MAG: FG-GAP-like repeat-containing protein, partial [Gemmatimonadota bacterium]|nr:FG-GAP-like repeat-containing protein [Gemmatimonadota bacterium]
MRSMLGMALVALSCATEPPVPYQAPSTKHMATRLAEIAQNLNPVINTYINAARVEYLKTLPQPPDTAARLRASAYLARELLRAGQSQAAIDEFEKLQPQLQQINLKLTPDVRVLLGLSYMRLGEQENCLARHSTASCLLPIGGDGVHTIERGSRSALAEFTAYLSDHPDDLTVRWLLNIAYMTLGMYPEQVPAQWLVPPEVFVSDHDIKRFADVAPALGLDLVSMAGGSIMDDFDGDGHLDIMVSSWGLNDQIRYFANLGNRTFAERTAAAGLTGIVGGLQIVHADYDNNGYADVLVLRGGWWEDDGLHPNSLFHNNGNGTF